MNELNYLKVVDVQPLRNYVLILTFSNGQKALYNVYPLLKYEAFEDLKNLDLFMTAHSNGVTVVWNDEIDIALEELNKNSTLLIQKRGL